MKTHSISVALSVYNGEGFLAELLHSITSQTFHPDEIIICDDGSEDNSLNVIHKYLKGTNYHIIQNHRNLGIQDSYSKTISRCTGDLIFLADQDDVWDPQKIEMMYEAFADNQNVGMVFSDSLLVDESLNEFGKTSWQSVKFDNKKQKAFLQGQSFYILLKNNVVTSSSTLAFRSRYIPLISPIPHSSFPDYWTSLILSACSGVIPLKYPLVKYRLHGSNALGINRNTLDHIKRAWQDPMAFPFSNQAALFRELKVRLDKSEEMGFSIPDNIYREIDNKINHLLARAALSPNRFKRCPVILQEITNRRYFKFSEGWKSVARDLIV